MISGFDVFLVCYNSLGVCSGLNKVDQLLWRMTTCGFGRRNSFFLSFQA